MEWQPVVSERIVATAYDVEQATIFVEFPDGVRWWYSNCDPAVWEEFNSPGVSMGRFIHDILDHHPNGRFDG